MTLAGLLTGLVPAYSRVQSNIPAERETAYCSVSREQPLDRKEIYFGQLDAKEFKKAASIDEKLLLASTPEYQKIKDEKIERGTGKYWILLSKASDRLKNSVTTYGQKNKVDLIVPTSYAQTAELGLSELCDATYPIWEQMGNKIEVKKISN